MLVNWKDLEKEVFPRGKGNLVNEIEKNSGAALHFQSDAGVKNFSYCELIEKVNEFANFLISEGAKKGDRIGLFMGKCPELYFGFLAAVKAGCVVVPLFEAFQTDGLELRLERGEVNFLFTTSELAGRLKNKSKFLKKVFIVDSGSFRANLENQSKSFESVNLDIEDTAMMIFTSSTAGTPVAGIELPHRGLVQWIYTAKKVLGIDSGTKYWCTAHPAWVTGAIYGVVAPFCVGCEVFCIEGRFDSKLWGSFLTKNKISHVYTAPTVLRLFKGEVSKQDFKFVKRICSVGEALPWSLWEHYDSLGVKIIDTYWQTEIGAIVLANLDFVKKSLGKPIGVHIEIKDGMMVIRTPWPAMMAGIYNHEKVYQEYFEDDLFKTNDLAEEKNGVFYFIGRKDDIIKTSGERVSPLEIENILIKHPAVVEAAVIGVPDSLRGEIIKAFVVLRDKKDDLGKAVLKQELSDFVKKNYAGHAYPKIIEFVEELPKGNSGKIVRMKLREEK
jgi:acetyl-CoA synthetase